MSNDEAKTNVQRLREMLRDNQVDRALRVDRSVLEGVLIEMVLQARQSSDAVRKMEDHVRDQVGALKQMVKSAGRAAT